MKRMKNEVKDKILADFLNKLNEFGFNSQTFINNSETLVIYKINKMFHEACAAEYNIKDNVIGVSNDFKETISHELLHVASTKQENNKIYTGLAICDLENDTFIGNGLNEALTMYIDIKYFNGDKEQTKGYINYSMLQHLFLMIPEETFIKCYFENDLKTIFDILSSYAGKKFARYIIEAMDGIYYSSELSNKLDMKTTIKNYRKFLKSYSVMMLYPLFTEYYQEELSEECLNIGLEVVEDLKYKEIIYKDKKISLFKEEELNTLITKVEDKVLRKVGFYED